MSAYKKITLVAFLCAFISALAGFFIFEMDWPFLPLPISSGIAIITAINEEKVYRYLDKLLFGAVLYGAMAPLLFFSRMYLVSNLIYHSGFPFWPLYNLCEFLMAALVFFFVCLLGGLIGIVGKGFIYLLINRFGSISR